jgi:putative multiple sugar transport system ATP-binding protein
MNEGRLVAEMPIAQASQERIMRVIVNSGSGVHGE